jgi:hypothetical protein
MSCARKPTRAVRAILADKRPHRCRQRGRTHVPRPRRCRRYEQSANHFKDSIDAGAGAAASNSPPPSRLRPGDRAERRRRGWSTIPGDERYAFFVDGGGGMATLGTLPGDVSSEAVAVNSARQVAGTSVSADGISHVFSWTTHHGMVAVGALATMSASRRRWRKGGVG